jgi:hypothetical protein
VGVAGKGAESIVRGMLSTEQKPGRFNSTEYRPGRVVRMVLVVSGKGMPLKNQRLVKSGSVLELTRAAVSPGQRDRGPVRMGIGGEVEELIWRVSDSTKQP